ncbi:hypothetical protein GZ77_06270 [Endozoicomonas montiporae]|uniref:Flagellin n=2 Tax=Endozoicomonas montiporae TaxID=1027273 RepID=A0A081NC92_9GAMM|nr:flagellin [Endozoicomonas montiporae]AMO56398.1 flagellin C [Endozoicomonas montiporae CL-33]KEQ16065.1 hypothetical protein GZ77_06270 [Endozoicomonas montiporae]
MITINSNNAAKMAQNILNSNQLQLTGNMKQLSTGLRINSAADDAAGLQIANRMQTQMQGLAVAQRNSSDAISMAQTAEAGMSESTNIMNRVRDLAMQSFNDTNKQEDREATQKEVEHLKEEINRIANTTNFAGINLLDGTSEHLEFQIGETAGDTITFGIDSVTGADLGSEVREATIPASFDDEGVLDADLALRFDGANETIAKDPGPKHISDVAEELNELLGDYDIEAEAVYSINPFALEIVGHEDDVDLVRNSAGGVLAGNNLSVDSINVETQAGATKAMIILDEALAQLDDQRADLGAVQNRLESTINNLTSMEENLGISQSRIQDADFAEQTVDMTSNQMLLQAGVSVLAQAKGMPQYASMLLP